MMYQLIDYLSRISLFQSIPDSSIMLLFDIITSYLKHRIYTTPAVATYNLYCLYTFVIVKICNNYLDIN